MVKKTKNNPIDFLKIFILCLTSCGKWNIPNKYSAVSKDINAHIDTKTSRFNIPQWETKSAFDKNFKAKASSIKPITIFVVLSQVPDLGISFKLFGNKENKPKGKAKAIPKPSIPNDNCAAPPSDVSDPANKEPNIGPVQEKETIDSVKAMKNKPITPFHFEDAESEKLDHLLGKVSS